MRNNGPVTQTERTFSADTKLISTTDLKGKITYCNEAFEAVSGFTQEELVGQPHNLVRHPDMPQEAFRAMWDRLKEGKPWIGAVKNRCKNGDFYWVSAYVSPLREGNNIVGYESVRTLPSRDVVRRAELAYAKLKAGKTARTWRTAIWKPWVAVALALMSLPLFIAAGSFDVMIEMAGAALLAFMSGAVVTMSVVVAKMRELSKSSSNDSLASYVYTGGDAPLNRIEMMIISQRLKLETVLTRLRDAAARMTQLADQGYQQTIGAHSSIEKQKSESKQIANGMQEIAEGIQTNTGHVQETDEKATEVTKLVSNGTQLATQTQNSIESLSNVALSVGAAIGTISEETQRISEAADMIEGIAEQTNLLALNAAIEAARAGEQGRGFAVVADEVRNLAQRTQTTTGNIHEAMQGLSSRVKEAMTVSDSAKQSALAGVEQVNSMEKMLNQIREAIEDISDNTGAMASAAKHHSQLLDKMNSQAKQVSTLAEDSLRQSDETASSITDVSKMAGVLENLVNQFR